MANNKRTTRSSRYENKNIKSGKNTNSNRVHTNNVKKVKKQNNMMLTCIILIVLLLSFLFMGWFLTLILALGFSCILLFKALIERTKNKKGKKVLYTVFIALLFLSVVGMLGICGFMLYIVESAPKFDTSKLNEKESTIIYDKDGKEFARLGTEMRENVTYDQLPDVLVDALISIEDSRFFEHNGVDIPRFTKVVAGQLAGKNVGGASTLSMQVIKNSFTSTEATGIKGIIRKFTDIYLAVFKLEKQYSKEEIIEFYVNNHYLGNNAYGVEQASQVYFGKSVCELNLAEASLLVGMFQAPSTYDPYNYPKNAEDRRKTVLYQMRKHGYITKEEEELANSIPVESLVSNTPTSSQKYQGFIDTLVEDIEKRYNVNPYSTPMVIYSTLDREKQKAVENILDGDGYKWVNKVIQCGVAVLDADTGRIIAIGAGRNREGSLSYNYATQIKRQIGSSAKPLFDYAPGIEYDNWSTYKLFDDEPWSYSDGTPMNNWDGGYYGTITLRKALSASRNVPALKAFQQNIKNTQNVGKDKVIDFILSLGLEPELCPTGYTYNKSTKKCVNKDNDIKDRSLHEAHSIGAFNGASPLQMAAAYAAFANGGYYYEPHSYTKIVFRDTDETITSASLEKTSKDNQVMSEATAYMISSVLQDVVGSSMKVKNVNYAAKTGTSNYDDATIRKYGLAADAVNDGWTIAYDSETVFADWLGYREISSKYYNRMIQQANMRDSLAKTLASALFKHDNSNFKMPSSVVKVGVEMGSDPAALPSSSTPKSKIVYELFKKGTEPKESSEAYSSLANPGYLNIDYNEANNSVNLTWGKVVPANSKDSYGTFGYYVYFNGKKLGFTEDTKYTITNPTTPYGTYKVVSAFSKYSKNQSSGISKTLEQKQPTPAVEYNVDTYPKTIILSEVATFDYDSTYTIKLNGASITPDSITHNDLIEEAGVQTINYVAMHDGNEIKFSVKITINN